MATKNLEKALEAVQLDINKEYGAVSYTHLTLPTICSV